MGYIPGGGLFHSALGDFLAAASNKYAGFASAAPGAVRLENALIAWLAEIVGYPAEAAGTLTSGGSLANLTAIVAAREARDPDGGGAVYSTEFVHHCLDKALHIAGRGRSPHRRVATDESHRMRPEALAEALERDQTDGIRPWLVIASAGTVDTGAVDPLPEIADLCARYGAWLHVDGAYGGLFMLCPEGRERLAGIERADSLALDPHKTMFLPYGTGAALVRDGQAAEGRVQRHRRLPRAAGAELGRPRAGRPLARAHPPLPRPSALAAASARRNRRLPRRPVREDRPRPLFPRALVGDGKMGRGAGAGPLRRRLPLPPGERRCRRLQRGPAPPHSGRGTGVPLGHPDRRSAVAALRHPLLPDPHRACRRDDRRAGAGSRPRWRPNERRRRGGRLARAAGGRYARPLFLATLLTGSFLLFLVQPMVARMALPRLGGAPAVWNSAMVVFQALLLGGYAYAHFLARLRPRLQAGVHLILFAVAALWLPIGLGAATLPADAQPAFWAPWLLLGAIGPLFFLVSAQAPLMQRWYALESARAEPYALYAASNLGSFAGLISYPILVEPLLTLRQQSLLWTAGYGLLVVLVAAAALTIPAHAVESKPERVSPAPTARRVLHWIALAAVPSGLMLSTTTHLTTDIVAVPLLWVVPLGLYLLSFVIAFATGRKTAHLFTAIAPLGPAHRRRLRAQRRLGAALVQRDRGAGPPAGDRGRAPRRALPPSPRRRPPDRLLPRHGRRGRARRAVLRGRGAFGLRLGLRASAASARRRLAGAAAAVHPLGPRPSGLEPLGAGGGRARPVLRSPTCGRWPGSIRPGRPSSASSSR
jgi:hypothetical protein